MKNKFLLIASGCIAALLLNCSNDNGKVTVNYASIESADAYTFSFDENGYYPYTKTYDRTKLGIKVYADSIVHADMFNKEPGLVEYTNYIDSLTIYTLYDFDKDHPKGSSINDILLPLRGNGETYNTPVNDLLFSEQYLKFSATPTTDYLKFKVTGRIKDRNSFTLQTNLVVLRKQ